MLFGILGGRGWDEYIDKSVGPFLKIILLMFPTCYAYVYSGESTTSMLLLRSFLVVSPLSSVIPLSRADRQIQFYFY